MAKKNGGPEYFMEIIKNIMMREDYSILQLEMS